MEKARGKCSLAERSKPFFILVLTALLIIASASLASSQADPYQSIKGVKFKDGSVVMGSVIQMNVDTITIRTEDGQTVVRKFDDVDKFLKSYDEVETLKKSEERLYSSFEFGFMYYYYDYKESLPSPAKSTESGWLPGIYLSYDYKKPSNIYVKLYGNIAGGNLNYDGATQPPFVRPLSFDHSQLFFKFEGNIGYTFSIEDKILLIPYTGYGYRYWRRGESKYVTNIFIPSFGSVAIYDTKEVYTWNYLPLGVKFSYIVDDRWSLGATAAVNFMFGGKMTAYRSENNPSQSDLDFDLGNKPGYYVEIPISYKFDRNWSIVATFWYEYSEIGKSNTLAGGAYEPDSTTNQYGLNLGVSYLF